MPVQCSTSALTGSSGRVMFVPAGVTHCLLDFTDFPDGSAVTVPGDHDFRVGDPVVFTVEGAAVLNTAFTAGTTYYVVAKTDTSITLSATEGGAAITFTQANGGTGSADTPDSHINIGFADAEVVCLVTDWSMDFTRDSIDTTTIPCSTTVQASKYANFATSIAGPASGSGSMTVLFTPDQAAVSNRLIYNTILEDQTGVKIKLYLNYSADSNGPDDTASMYIEAPVSLTGFSVTANTTEVLSAEITFDLTGPPTHLFYDDL